MMLRNGVKIGWFKTSWVVVPGCIFDPFIPLFGGTTHPLKPCAVNDNTSIRDYFSEFLKPLELFSRLDVHRGRRFLAHQRTFDPEFRKVDDGRSDSVRVKSHRLTPFPAKLHGVSPFYQTGGAA